MHICAIYRVKVRIFQMRKKVLTRQLNLRISTQECRISGKRKQESPWNNLLFPVPMPEREHMIRSLQIIASKQGESSQRIPQKQWEPTKSIW